jgi:diguanylate cyclase (GGDEF)-like protein
MLKRLRALHIAEDRPLAGQLAGALYITGAFSITCLLFMPGVETDHWVVALALAGYGAAWGLVCLFAIPWERVHPLVSHFSSSMGLPIVAVGMAATGGAQSPVGAFLFFVIFYAAYFYRPAEAIPYFFACLVVQGLPLVYDSNAVDDGLVGQLFILGPTYFALGGLILAGKRRLVELREQAHRLSREDPLTELSNRRALMEVLERRVGGRRTSDRMGLLMVDLDGFKDVNSLYGHPAGDEVLRKTAVALQTAVRPEDMVARLGGDEFAIVAFGTSQQAMAGLTDRVQQAIKAADERLELPDFSLRASLGWALYPDHAGAVDELIAAADLGTRAAKAIGKDTAQSPMDWLPDEDSETPPSDGAGADGEGSEIEAENRN